MNFYSPVTAGLFLFFRGTAMKKLDFCTYAKLHNAFQTAKLLRGDYVDLDILKLIKEKSRIEQKYKKNSIDKWAAEDVERLSRIIKYITCYMKGLNIAESILQKVGELNNDV